MDGMQAHCSGVPPPPVHQLQPTVDKFPKAEQLIRDAEASRARIYEVKGNEQIPDKLVQVCHSAALDEEYLLVGNYLDQTMKQWIGMGEYINFAKLMPREKVFSEDDTQMEIVNRGGQSYWVPVSDQENTTINNFARWEQAFRVYSNVYTTFHPTRAGELIQYNHIIHTALQTYCWDNVYRYDREFHVHMSRHHLN